VMARELAAGGMRVILLEAGDRVGGKVASHTVGGIELDSGAESFATRGGTVAALAAELGLKVVQPRAGGAWLKPVVGDPLPLPATSLLGIPGSALATDVINVIGYKGAFRAVLDQLMLGFFGSKERTLGALVRRRMGSAVLEKLVAPVVTGIHSRHPDELDVDVVAPGLRAALLDQGSLALAVRSLRAAAPAGSAVAGIDGGIHVLIEQLALDAKALGVDIRTGVRVSAANPAGVTTDGGEITADHVVLATPLDAPTEATIVLATLVIDAATLDSAPRGTGLLVAAGAAGVGAKALTHSTAKWPWLAAKVAGHRHVVRLSYSAEAYNAQVSEGFENQARHDAEVLLGVPIPADAVLGFDTVAWPAVPPRPVDIPGVTLVGESASGTGLAAIITHARREAGRLLKEVES
jgi:oxygen-dependent protoporphyrinogen oxidase